MHLDLASLDRRYQPKFSATLCSDRIPKLLLRLYKVLAAVFSSSLGHLLIWC